MDVRKLTRNEVGALGERIAEDYLKRQGFRVEGRNIARKTGELDRVVSKGGVLHIVEIKTLVCAEFPREDAPDDAYDPAVNLHAYKIRKVARTAEWYVAERDWEGDWQVDGVLVWLRARDGTARVQHLPQIL